MSKNVVTPKRVSFEDALRNLASRLTGRPAAELPRSQEGIVQFMAENVPTLDEMAEAITQEALARLAAAAPAEVTENVAAMNEVAEAITQEVLARLAATAPIEGPGQADAPAEGAEPEKPDSGQQEAHDGLEASGGTPTPGEGEKPDTEAPVADNKPKRGSGSKAKTTK